MFAMLLQPFVRSRQFFTALALVGALAGTGAAFVAGATPGAGFFGLMQSDVFSFFFRLLVGMVAVLVILAANSYLERENLPTAEFYALRAVCDGGHGRAGVRARTSDGVHRAGDEFHFELHPGGIPARFDEVERSFAEIFSAGIVCHGIFSVWHRIDVRRDGHDESRAHG